MADPTGLAVQDMPISLKTLDILSKGPTVPTRYKDKPYDMMAAVLVGREMGVEPMEAINNLYLVNGQVSMSGKLMSALVHRAGHELRASIDSKAATVEAWRRDLYTHELEKKGEVTFSLADAKKAGLDEKEVYKAYPMVMCTWRALSQVCRFYFADVMAGVTHVPEEVNIESPLEVINLDEDLSAVVVDGVDIDAENNTANAVNVLEADVIA